MSDYIDASTYTRVESLTRLNYGKRFTRPTNWGQNNTGDVDNFGCQRDMI